MPDSFGLVAGYLDATHGMQAMHVLSTKIWASSTHSQHIHPCNGSQSPNRPQQLLLERNFALSALNELFSAPTMVVREAETSLFSHPEVFWEGIHRVVSKEPPNNKRE